MSMNPASEDVRDKLVANGDVQTSAAKAWFVTLSHLPDKPRNCVLIKDSPGAGPQHTADVTQKPLRTDGVQVFVRGEGYRASWDKAWAIAGVITGWGSSVFQQGGSRYHFIQQRGSIAEFNRSEETDIWTWVFNVVIQREEV